MQKTEGWGNTPIISDYTWGPGGLLHRSHASSETLYVPGTGQRINGVYRFFHLDWLGSTRSLTDAAGATTSQLRYDAFGNRTSVTPADPLHATDFQCGGAWGYQTESVYWRVDGTVGLGLVGVQVPRSRSCRRGPWRRC